MCDLKIISRADATALDLKRYFTGEPCKHGHVSERITSNGCCATCSYAKCKAQYAADPKAGSERTKAYRAANLEKVRESKKASDRANIERVHAYNLSYYAANQEKGRARSLTFYAEKKTYALEFNRELLAGKYPHLIPADHAPYILYTAFNRETLRDAGRPLYIGITDDWQRRRKEHAATAKGSCWLTSADDVHLDVYPNQTMAMAAEALAIYEKRPLFNDIHNDDEDMRALR
jgi:hypothetical protein